MVLDFLNWTVAALADGPPWSTQDGGRLQRADQASMRGVVAKVKGDWAEYVHTLGLQSWSHPCFKCHAPRRDRRCKSGVAPYAASSPESKVGRRGRVLQNDIPSLDGDRLEPSRSLRDIREFDRVPRAVLAYAERDIGKASLSHVYA